MRIATKEVVYFTISYILIIQHRVCKTKRLNQSPPVLYTHYQLLIINYQLNNEYAKLIV